MITTTTRTCQHIKADGAPCKAAAMNGSAFCFFHDPTVSAKRKAAQRAGGIERSKAAAVLPPEAADIPVKTVQDVVQLLGQTINLVRKGQIDPRVSNAVGYLAGIMLKALDQSDIEKRLAAVEATVNQQFIRPGSVFDQDALEATGALMKAAS